MKTKLKFLVFLFLALNNLFTFSQSLNIIYEDFAEWTKKISLTGYQFVQSDNQSAEYIAFFTKDESSLSLNLTFAEKFLVYKEEEEFKNTEPYDRNGIKMVYLSNAASSKLISLLSKGKVTFTLAAEGSPLDKNTMEKMFDNLKIAEKWNVGNDLGNSWPAEISADKQIPNVEIQRIEKTPIKTNKITYEYHIFVTMNASLIAELTKFTQKFKGDLATTDLGDFFFMCNDADSIDQLRENKKDGETVELIFYKK